MSLIKGTVKWFNDAKGFGFITHKDGDVFVHYSIIQGDGFKTLKEGEEVEYSLATGEKGLQAKEVIRSPEAIAASLAAGAMDGAQLRGKKAASQNAGLRGSIEIAVVEDQDAQSSESERSAPAEQDEALVGNSSK